MRINSMDFHACAYVHNTTQQLRARTFMTTESYICESSNYIDK